MTKEKEQINQDARGQAIKAVMDKIGHGITWDDANETIKIILQNWKTHD